MRMVEAIRATDEAIHATDEAIHATLEATRATREAIHATAGSGRAIQAGLTGLPNMTMAKPMAKTA
jgi:hypothetical protein